jgi:hypothetical protein
VILLVDSADLVPDESVPLKRSHSG